MKKRKPKAKGAAPSAVENKNGLPEVLPDAAEQDIPDEPGDIIPAHGYEEIPMVALGGSAGSLVALQAFFEKMPADSGMIFVVVVHLAPEHTSILPELLGRCTGMPVRAAEDNEQVEPNHVYVIPPGKRLTAVDSRLRLTPLEPEAGPRMAVDFFFRSLADTHGPHARAIVLSGADGDGALGIKRIKERGGLTIAQDPVEAEHEGMPQSAIATGMVDWVLPVGEIPGRLLNYRASAERLRVPPEEGPQPVAHPPEGRTGDEVALGEVLAFLRVRTGRDFSCYKRATIVRRVARRLQINGIEDLQGYLSFLSAHPGETGALLQDLLISVTNFFRDRDAFKALEEMIPAIFMGKGPGDMVRVWIPACATGEEAYSLAILLLEYARRLDAPPGLQVFGSDLNEHAIQQARAGVYPGAIAADVGEARLQRFFVKDKQGWRVSREMREIVLFSAHDLLKDAPFSRMDLISNRNLLIYLNREAQNRALDIFHFALKPHGLLFLGSSESVDEGSRLFKVVDKKHRIYRQQPANRAGLSVPVLTGGSFDHLPQPLRKEDGESAAPGMSPTELHFRLIERYAPPSAIVNAHYHLVHLSENAGRFLVHAGGEPTTNLLRLVHPMLRVELRGALFQAAENSMAIEVPRVPVELEGERRAVTLRVTPAREIAPGFLLVTFDLADLSPAGEGSADSPPVVTESEPLVRQLERENEVLKGRLRDTVEQYESGNEELKASNEELQAMNEELRSASEELETSREELQSINEELSTVNDELKIKIEELGRVNSDLHNLMAATAIATIFLDRDLCIMRYTPPAVALFQLIPGDIGRPLSDLRPHLQYPELPADVSRVLKNLAPIEREVPGDDRWYLARLLPYRTLDDRIAGAVLTFVDITENRRAQEAVRTSEEQFRRAIEAAPIPVIMHAEDGQVLQISNTWTELTGFTREDIPTFDAWLNHAYGPGAMKVRDHVRRLFEGATRQADVELEVKTRSGETRRWTFSASAPGTLSDGRRFIVGMAQDVTERIDTEARLRESKERVRLIVENAREYAICSMSLDRRVVSWNPGAEALTGYTEEEAVGQFGDIIFTPEDRAAGIPAREARTALAEGRCSDERWHLRKDGTRFFGGGVMTPMHDDTGEAIGLLKIFRDLTEDRRSREELEESKADLWEALQENEGVRVELESANTAKDHFLAVLSHELRTPLAPILMAVKMFVEQGDLSPEMTEAMEMIERNVELEAHMIDDLLDVTRITRGKFELEMADCRLHEIIRRAVETVKPDFAAKRQELILSLDAGDDQIRADAVRVQQAFWNLLKNASKFTPERGTVRLRTWNEGNGIRAALSDSGIGFAPGAVERIFEPFLQADAQITRLFGGLGIGLAIVKAVINEHSGNITAVSDGPGKGATFTVELPLKQSSV